MIKTITGRRRQGARYVTVFPSGLLLLLLLLLFSIRLAGANRLSIAQHRRGYDDNNNNFRKLQHGKANEFRFGRFQSLQATKAAFDECRSPTKSFKAHNGKDGRKGFVSSTKLGGDWVLAESEQLAPSCTCEQVLRAYLDGGLQKKWSADKVIDVTTRPSFKRGCDPYYRQDLVLHSQRVIRSHTGVMRYSQRITVDKIGADNYCAFVELDPDQGSSTAKKPFNSLSVYVGLQQAGKDVKIYAAGVFEVNRKVVPNLVVFDASGIAGNMAGKGTLWLAGHFEEMRKSRTTATATVWRGAQGAGTTARGFARALRNRLETTTTPMATPPQQPPALELPKKRLSFWRGPSANVKTAS